VSEETDWEQCYVERNTPWDQGAPSPVLVQFLDAESIDGQVVVPGCGSGHDITEIARRSGKVTVLGLDLSSSAVALAEERLQSIANASTRAADLFDLDSQLHSQFDWVFEHTCFCAIDPDRRADYVQAVFQLLKPGGKLLAVFYLNPKERGDGSNGPPFASTVEELDELFAERFEVERSEVPNVAFLGREGRELLRVFIKKSV
jgi:SAM-dependent methyltransferase